MSIFAYLTIDDAPSHDFQEKCRLLEHHGIPAVWFCQGNYMKARSEMVIEAIRHGFIIGNHSYSHPSFEDISIEQGCQEIRLTDSVIDGLHRRAGVPRQNRYFRFPYGNKGNRQNPTTENNRKRDAFQAYLQQLGYIQPSFDDVTHPWFQDLKTETDWCWTRGFNDWAPFFLEIAPPEFDTPEKVLADLHQWNLQSNLTSGQQMSAEVIILHDLPGTTANGLFHDLIQGLVEKGIQFKSCAG